MEGMNRKKQNTLFILWIVVSLLGAFAVSAKMLIAGFTADEEYQLVMGYRLATGDRLFTEVWDTIQTSGFLCAVFTRIFLGITGTTEGIVLFLRGVGIALQAVCAFFLYRCLQKRMGRGIAYTLSISFFCFYTKLIAMPDFSNMQMWFLTLMCIGISEAMDAFESDRKKAGTVWIIVAATWYAAAVLSTACVIMVPLIAVFLYLCFGKEKARVQLIFWGICLVEGLLYFTALILANGSVKSILSNMLNTVSGDSTHMHGDNIVGQSKWMTYLLNLKDVCLYMAVTVLLAYGICLLCRKMGRKQFSLETVWIAISLFVTNVKWMILNEGFDTLKLFLPVVVCCGIFHAMHNRKTLAEAEKRQQYFLLFTILCGILSFVNVLLISNVPLTNNLAFLGCGFFWAAAALVSRAEKAGRQKEMWFAGIFLCLTLIAGSGYTLTNGPFGNNIFNLDGIVRNGPAKNILMSRGAAWVYHTDYIDFENVVPEGSNVLIVTDFFKNASVTSCYMINDVNISHYSVNSTPTFSAKLEEYWKLFPEKTPDVIMVNSYTVTLGEGDWITDYLKREFDPENAVVCENASFYFRKK